MQMAGEGAFRAVIWLKQLLPLPALLLMDLNS
jgi:hypothetical protein